MKKLLVTIPIVSFLLLVAFVACDIYAGYVYDNTIMSYWNLSIKASTLQQKATYLDQYVAATEAANLSGNDALIFPTPDNNYDQNLIALKSLQKRMHEIEHMDVQSFQYQQAISQITAQEQGEARSMLETLKNIYFKCNHPIFWDIYELLIVSTLLLGIFIPIVLFLWWTEREEKRETAKRRAERRY